MLIWLVTNTRPMPNDEDNVQNSDSEVQYEELNRPKHKHVGHQSAVETNKPMHKQFCNSDIATFN